MSKEIYFDYDKIHIKAMKNLEDYDKYCNAPLWKQIQMFGDEVERIEQWYIDVAEEYELQRLAAREGIEI